MLWVPAPSTPPPHPRPTCLFTETQFLSLFFISYSAPLRRSLSHGLYSGFSAVDLYIYSFMLRCRVYVSGNQRKAFYIFLHTYIQGLE